MGGGVGWGGGVERKRVKNREEVRERDRFQKVLL